MNNEKGKRKRRGLTRTEIDMLQQLNWDIDQINLWLNHSDLDTEKGIIEYAYTNGLIDAIDDIVDNGIIYEPGRDDPDQERAEE